MPWVTLCFDSKNENKNQVKEKKYIFRNLSKPVGLMRILPLYTNPLIVEAASKKIAEFEKRFLSSEMEDSSHPYFFDSFISSPYIVLDYCIRLEPFSKCSELSDYYKSIDSKNLKKSWKDFLESLETNVYP